MSSGGGGGYRAVEETSNDLNNMLLKSSTEKEISGMHEVRCHHYATILRKWEELCGTGHVIAMSLFVLLVQAMRIQLDRKYYIRGNISVAKHDQNEQKLFSVVVCFQ